MCQGKSDEAVYVHGDAGTDKNANVRMRKSSREVTGSRALSKIM